jgi:MYXO-CTERM domain-containing protein
MPYKPCDENGFALEMDDASGKPLGKFVPVSMDACVNTGTAPTDVDVRVLTDGTAVTHNGAHMGMTAWDLCWTAPAAGAGVITAYLAAVDGNGGNGTEAFPNDTIGDDVAAGTVPMAEAGAQAPPPQTGGCSAGSDAGVGLAIAIAVALTRGRRRRLAAMVLAVATLGSCVHVRPRQRETLAKRNMKFAPDPTEDELDLHMQESREGSAGGYGSAGGGCGCN